MKAYGKKRKDNANRHLHGQSRPCPCCVPRSGARRGLTKANGKAARQAGKNEVRKTIKED